MGIPRFYRWLKGRYPLIRMDLSDTDKALPIIDNFYIDFNALVYQCIRQHGCFLKNKIQPLTIGEIHERVFDYLFEMVRKANPRKLLFISLDGPAPRAKINQSRDRRFKASLQEIDFFDELLGKLKLENKECFKPNSISPGTQFLFDLCNSLRQKVMQCMNTLWSGLTVLFSDCSVPGEGEHKIMDFLRYSKRNQLFHQHTTHCVYSPDADLILLSLSLDLEYVCLLKEDTSAAPSQSWTASSVNRGPEKPLFEMVMINVLREYLMKQFDCDRGKVQYVTDDLVLLIGFVGNDFLPVEFCFVLKDNHMDNLFNGYKTYLKQNTDFINVAGNIHWGNILKLLDIVRVFQASMISEKKPRREETEMFKDEDVFEVEDHRIVKGREQYYRKRFSTTEAAFLDELIKKYLQGLEFYCRYYYQGVPSWSWFYPYHYTPLLCDVYDYIQKHPVNCKLFAQMDAPFDPILALMMMIPTHNFDLLPPALANALSSPQCVLRTPQDYFPTSFKLDPFETLSYNKHALIEFLSEQQARTVYDSVKGLFSKEEKERNCLHKTMLYEWSNGKLSGIEVDFGEALRKELQRIMQPKYQVVPHPKRFPSLSLFGAYSLNDRSKITTPHRYGYSEGQLVYFNHFQGYVARQEKCTEALREQIAQQYDRYGISVPCEHYYVVRRCRRVREVKGYSLRATNHEVIVPDFALFASPDYEFLHQELQPKEELQAGERVGVLAKGKYFGCLGVVEKNNGDSLTVRLIGGSILAQDKIEEFEEPFYSVDHVLDQLNVSYETLFAIVSDVKLLPVISKADFNDRIPTALNFGVNFINPALMKIVPRFVRCQIEFQNTDKPQEIFTKMEFSASALSILKKYFDTFDWLVEFLEDQGAKKEIRARDIFTEEEEVNIRLFSEFIKLYSLPIESPFYSIYSKVAVQEPFAFIRVAPKESIEVGCRQLARFNELLAYRCEPEYHAIGDRVLNLKTMESGYVVGIDDDNMQVHVGSKVTRAHFCDLYNQKWESYCAKEGPTWNMELSYFTPSFWCKAVS